MTSKDIFWLALNCYHESRGEPFTAMVKQVHVTLNRSEKRGLDIKDTVLQPWQFSWANSYTAEHDRLPPVKDMDAMENCFNAVDRCLKERENGDKFEGSDHYYADYIPEPKWAKGMTFIGKCGRHLFFRS